MVNIKVYADGAHFVGLAQQPNNKHLDIYIDSYVSDCRTVNKKNIAILCEPRSLIPNAYEYVKQRSHLFGAIFTHDSELLALNNAYYLNWSSAWLKTDKEKRRGISLCTSYKNWCPLHKARLELADYFNRSDKVDVFYGAWNDPRVPVVEPRDYLERYKFTIAIENDIDKYWYTEKLLNCFSNKVVPIYVGAPMIGDIFNIDGVIQVHDWKLIPEIVRTLDIDAEYDKRQQAIDDNYERVKPYMDFWEDRFIRDYEYKLEELMNE